MVIVSVTLDSIFVTSIQTVLLLFEMMQSDSAGSAVWWFGILKSFNLNNIVY